MNLVKEKEVCHVVNILFGKQDLMKKPESVVCWQMTLYMDKNIYILQDWKLECLTSLNIKNHHVNLVA